MLKITKDSLLSHPRGPAVLSNADLMVLSEDIYQGLNGDISCAVNEPELGHTSSLINVARKTALLSALWGAMGSDDWMQLPWDDRIISLLDDHYKVTLPKRTKVKDAPLLPRKYVIQRFTLRTIGSSLGHSPIYVDATRIVA